MALARQRVAASKVVLAAAERLYSLYASVEGSSRGRESSRLIDRRAARDQAAARHAVAMAEYQQARTQVESVATIAELHHVRAPRAAQVLQIRMRVGQYATAGPAPGSSDPLMILGETHPLHVRINVDESDIDRALLGRPATISPRGSANRQTSASYVRTEPLVIPKKSLTNDAAERVDVRVLQLIYSLAGVEGFFVGQQVDAFIPARPRGSR